jgi:hypothetical protein
MPRRSGSSFKRAPGTTSTHSTKTSTHRQESRWLFLPHSALHLGRVQGPWSRPPCDTLPNFNNGRLTGDEKLESEDHWTLSGRRRGLTGDEKLESEAHCALSRRRKHGLRLRNERSPPELLTSPAGDRDAEQTRTVLSKRRAKNGRRGRQQPFYRLCIQMRAAWRLLLIGREDPPKPTLIGWFSSWYQPIGMHKLTGPLPQVFPPAACVSFTVL